VGEETFALHLKAAKAPKAEREYRFCDRKWAFDFAWPAIKLAVEIDGGTASGKSRHSFGKGYEGDCDKLNTAVDLGWRVLRFSTNQVTTGKAIETTIRMMKGKL
jgi:very-short-patch-repair endonuclease